MPTIYVARTPVFGRMMKDSLREMSSVSQYRVSFFKTLCNSTGHSFKCLQLQVDVDDVSDERQAEELASRQLEKMRGLQNWRQVADLIEVQGAER